MNLAMSVLLWPANDVRSCDVCGLSRGPISTDECCTRHSPGRRRCQHACSMANTAVARIMFLCRPHSRCQCVLVNSMF